MRLPPRRPGGWPVILADPPWSFQTYSGAKVPQRALIPHYQCMSLEDLMAIPVVEVVADDAMLFLWILDSMIPEAIQLAASWGFPRLIKAGFVWRKPNMGMGYWSRNDNEICLMFARGRPGPRLNADVRQSIKAPEGRHSEKPIDTYEKIERLIGGPYLELFAREDACAYKQKGWRAGWTPWGLEAPGLWNRLARLNDAVAKLTEIVSIQARTSVIFEKDTRPCTMGVGCDESGFCYAMAHDHPEECPFYDA